MKILAWNSRASKEIAKDVNEFLSKHDPTIVCLIPIKASADKMKAVQMSLGRDWWGEGKQKKAPKKRS